MTSTEAPFSVTVKSSKGDLYTLRGANWGDFITNLSAALGDDEAIAFAENYKQAFGVGGNAFQSAAQHVMQAFPTASVGGQAAPQQYSAPAPAGGNPPGVAYPGDCQHGTRVYVDKPARGKPWQRFECAIPWSKENAAMRCKPVNV